jgi:hypothetical protein
MNPQEAEKIINLYGAALGGSRDIVRRKSLLPCSVPKIKLAYYIYIEALIKKMHCLKPLEITFYLPMQN